MSKIKINFTLLFSLCILAFSVACNDAKIEYQNTIVEFENGSKINVQIADTNFKKTYGLMYRESIKANEGMLFLFENDEERSFWMKNTLIDLDIIFITADKKIHNIEHNVSKSTINTPTEFIATATGIATYVLEIKSGIAKKHKLEKGQSIKFEL